MRVKYRRGFTITEMLVALGVIILLVGISFTSYRKYQCSVSLKNGVNTFTGDLKWAQQIAIQNPYPTKATPVQYRIDVTQTGYTLKVFQDKNEDGTYAEGEFYKLEKEVAFPVPVVCTPAQIVFMQAGVPVNAQGSPVKVELILSVDNVYFKQSKKIVISTTGAITPEDL